jgi:hypothetical protein
MGVEDSFLVNDARMASWRAEARANPPNLDDWAHLVTMLRLAAEINGDSARAENIDLPGAAIASAECSVRAVVGFLQRQPYLGLHGEAVAPLVRLQGALWDITEGRAPAMFKTIGGKRQNPGRGQTAMLIQAMAARTLTEFIAAEVDPKDAAKRIAKALDAASRRGLGKITPETIINWRHRLMGAAGGPGARPEAVQHYREPLPPGLGASPMIRAEALLEILSNRAAALV